MMRHVLWTSAVWALAVAAQTVPVPTTVQHLEVDIVFPRNETYKAADAFPIVFAVQNLTVLTSLGK
jgi:hypothetical protein